MTHIGENPFKRDNDTVFDDELKELLQAEQSLDQPLDDVDPGTKILETIIPIFDNYVTNRLHDIDDEIENNLQTARLKELEDEVRSVLLLTEEGQMLSDEGLLEGAVRYRANLILIKEIRIQRYILNIAVNLIYHYEQLDNVKKIEQIGDFEDTKRTYLVLLLDHYHLDMKGWPAAFDKVTPGLGLAPGIDLNDYINFAKPFAKGMIKKEQDHETELRTLQTLVGADKISDYEEMVDVLITLAKIQSEEDSILSFDLPNVGALRGEMIWEFGSIGGLTAEQCKIIADFYDTYHPV